MTSEDASPYWYRGTTPEPFATHTLTLLTGPVTQSDVDAALISDRERGLFFQLAVASGLQIPLDGTGLASTWSQFEDCTFTQKSKAASPDARVAAQGSFGTRPSIYRRCRFVGVHFRTLGGFSMLSSTFEDCTFERCKFNGNFAHETDLVRCTFLGQVDGCVWFGRDTKHDRTNVVRSNDFSRATITANVGWRGNFPLEEQRWPDGYEPLVDDD